MDIVKPGVREEEKNPYAPKDNKGILSWRAHEFSYYEKSRNWFIVAGIIFFLLLGYSIITKQLITALTFLLIGITVYIFSLKRPREVRCKISRGGISVDNVQYNFRDLQSFWIFFEPPDLKVISLKHRKPYLPYIQIPLGDEDPVAVRRALMEFLIEEEQDESFSDKLARYLRF